MQDAETREGDRCRPRIRSTPGHHEASSWSTGAAERDSRPVIRGDNPTGAIQGWKEHVFDCHANWYRLAPVGIRAHGLVSGRMGWW
jgi:hypothetical protein